MRTVAVVNSKGGVGKTTVTVNLAAAFVESGKKILTVDLDPQANLSAWLGIRDGGRGLLDVFTSNTAITGIIRHTPFDIDVVPSSRFMVQAERLLHGEVGAEFILKRALEGLPADYDYVLIDCPPALGVLVVNALAAVREVLVPVHAHFLSLLGLAQLYETIQVVRDRLNPDLELMGIVPCRVDTRTKHSVEVVEMLRERFGDKVYQTVIHENIRVAECPSFAQPITAYAPKSRGAEDFRALASEISCQGESHTAL
ncbi:MAG: ParA family protein [Pseudomonadota bacterium]